MKPHHERNKFLLLFFIPILVSIGVGSFPLCLDDSRFVYIGLWTGTIIAPFFITKLLIERFEKKKKIQYKNNELVRVAFYSINLFYMAFLFCLNKDFNLFFFYLGILAIIDTIFPKILKPV